MYCCWKWSLVSWREVCFQQDAFWKKYTEGKLGLFALIVHFADCIIFHYCSRMNICLFIMSNCFTFIKAVINQKALPPVTLAIVFSIFIKYCSGGKTAEQKKKHDAVFICSLKPAPPLWRHLDDALVYWYLLSWGWNFVVKLLSNIMSVFVPIMVFKIVIISCQMVWHAQLGDCRPNQTTILWKFKTFLRCLLTALPLPFICTSPVHFWGRVQSMHQTNTGIIKTASMHACTHSFKNIFPSWCNTCSRQ